MMNNHEKGRRRPRLRVRDCLPYVEMGVALTAVRVSLSGERLREVEGITLTSEPVSTRKRVWVCASVT